jgi:histidinol-phosphate phosphatase family protein
MPVSFDIVIPTIGRASLSTLLDALARARGPRPGQIFVVDDRRDPGRALLDFRAVNAPLVRELTVLRGRAAGPAAARNIGWRASGASWVAFVDDDVLPDHDWLERLVDDLAKAEPDVGGCQGQLRVPLGRGRRPTDWERNVRGLEDANWATADMAYRRAALAAVGGFDERFPRAYREDADLALRVAGAGWRLVRGRRSVMHPVRAADWWVSVRAQAGNADDVLMRAKHGRGWRARAGVPRGRRPAHLVLSGAALAAVIAALGGRRAVASGCAAAWLLGTGAFAWQRIAPGPRTRDEIVRMAITSAVIPAAATYHWIRGWLGLPSWLVSGRAGRRTRPKAVLFDRDGTLVVDVPHNGDPGRVTAMPGARAALERLRAAGVPLAVVSNQSGIARGLITTEDVRAVNDRIETLLGPLGPWLVCPHGADDRCRCRKPAPALIDRAAALLGVRPSECAVIGDTGADVDAALAAGARPILVPNDVTRREEIEQAPEVAPDLATAVTLLLDGTRTARERT